MPILGTDSSGTVKQCCECGAVMPLSEFRLANNRKNPELRAGKCRFCYALQTNRRQGKKFGYAFCTASAKDLRIAFTGYCHICGISELECKRKLSVDHCHGTGVFRGWLCAACNVLLGMSGDSVARLKKAQKYLER